MKTILVLAALATACAAHTATIGPYTLCDSRKNCVAVETGHLGGTITSSDLVHYAPIEPPKVYIVEYTTEEPRYECGVRLAVNCADGNAGCGVPKKYTAHTQNFKTLSEAMRFLNDGMVVNERVGLPYEWAKQFVRLLEAVEVPIKVTTTEKNTPQPPIKVQTKQYTLR